MKTQERDCMKPWLRRSAALLAAACLAACASAPGTAVLEADKPPAAQVAAPAASTDQLPAGAQALREDEALAHYRLANGLEVIVKPDRRAPTAIHMLWVRVGSIDEADGTSGVAHALEHMMFKGSKALAPGVFSRRVAELGGQDNAFTSLDYTAYFQQVPVQQLGVVMGLEAERFAHNQWPDEEFTREIEVIKEERRLRTDDQPRAKLFEQLMAATFMAAPQRRPIIGWMDDLQRMRAEDVRAFYRQWYVPANAAVVVVGQVQPRQALALVARHYGDALQGSAQLAATLPARKITQEPPQQGPRRIVLRDRVEQPVLLMAFKAPALQQLQQPTASDREALALMALAGVLSGYEGARLERALVRGPQRVADSVDASAMLSNRSGNGLFLLSAIPAPGRDGQAVEQALRRAIAEVAQRGVGQQELQRVVTQWTAATVYEQDSMFAQANELGRNWVQGWPLDASELLIQRLREVTPEQVQAVAARYFGDDGLTVAELQPQAPSAAASTAPKATRKEQP